MSVEAMKQALDALEDATTHNDSAEKWRRHLTAMDALRQAIEQAERQEPVAWQVHPFDYGIGHEGAYALTTRPEQVNAWKRKGWDVQPLYTAPQKREWVGLTQEDIDIAFDDTQEGGGFDDFARAIEAKLREKNGG
jgi:hypothetical protein